MLRMTSVDSGIEAECESNDCTNHSSSICHSNSMSVVPFTSSTSDVPLLMRESLRCASSMMAQPSTSSSCSGSDNFPSIFEIEGGPQIMIVGYNDDRAPYKIISNSVKKWRRRFCQLGTPCPVGGGGGGHFPPAINTSIRSLYAPPHNPNSAIQCRSSSSSSRKMNYKCLRKYGQHRMAPYVDDARTRSLVQNAFHQAASTNNSEKLLTMIHRDVDPNITDELNRTALHKAACKGYTDSVRVLLENGANPNLRDNVGNTALHLAACTNHIDVITLLLQHDCDASSTDFSGRSPLQLAQSKLKILAKSNHSASHDTLKTEILKVIDMLLLFVERKKSRRQQHGNNSGSTSSFRSPSNRACDEHSTSSLVSSLSSLCSDLTNHSGGGTSGIIRPASFTLDESAKLAFQQNINNNNNAGTSFSSRLGGINANGCHGNDSSDNVNNNNNNNNDDLNSDIELLNMFQNRMKLSENVEGDLTELMNNLDQLKIAIDASKTKV